MPNVKSTQETDKDASPRVPLRVDESHSRLRRSYFRYIHKAAALPGVGDLIALLQIPAGSKFFGGRFKADAGIGAATTQMSIGIVGDVAGFRAATVVGDAAVDLAFGDTRALDWGKLFTVETQLIATVSVAATDGVDDLEIVGYIEFTID